jgi:hypothetical protein
MPKTSSGYCDSVRTQIEAEPFVRLRLVNRTRRGETNKPSLRVRSFGLDMTLADHSFQEFIDAIQTAEDRAEFERIAGRITERLGFRWFAYLRLSDSRRSRHRQQEAEA